MKNNNFCDLFDYCESDDQMQLLESAYSGLEAT